MDQTYRLLQNEQGKFVLKQQQFEQVLRFKEQDMAKYKQQCEQIKAQLADFKAQVNTHIKTQFSQHLEQSIFGAKYKERLQKKEKQLFDWEAELHAKKLEVNGIKEFVSQKQDKLAIEGEQVSQKIKHLQKLTAQYDNLYEKEKEISSIQQDVQQQKQQIQSMLISKDELLEHIMKEREMLAED